MEGYELVTSDGCRFGRVVRVAGDNLIVEHGKLRKSQLPLPRTFASLDESDRVVRASVTKDVLEDAPKVDHGEVDELAVARHYGLAAGETDPETLGYGDVDPHDPARTAEDDMRSVGITPAYQKGTEVRDQMRPGGSESGPRDPRFPTDTEPTR